MALGTGPPDSLVALERREKPKETAKVSAVYHKKAEDRQMRTEQQIDRENGNENQKSNDGERNQDVHQGKLRNV